VFGFYHTKSSDVLFHGYFSIALITRNALLLVALVIFPDLSSAQEGKNIPEAYAQADAQRNAAYFKAWPHLSPLGQQRLMNTELAWTNFSEGEKALMAALQSDNLVSEEFAQTHSIDVVEARTNHLKAFFVDHKIDYPVQYTPQNRNQELNRVYAECFRRMTESSQRLLVASEREWIAYRDADIAAEMTSYDDLRLRDAVIVHLTLQRTGQLASIIQSLGQVPATNASIQNISPPSMVGAANEEDLKSLVEFQGNAKACLSAFVAKKDDPFFKKADVIKNVPELPSDVSDQISKLDAQYVALPRKPDPTKLFEPAVNECAAVELLASWSKFTQQVKAGKMVDAGLTIQRAVSQQPKDVSSDYFPLWQAVESWREVYVNDKSDFYDHVRKAQSFAQLGKTSAAIKEYQAAYDIVEDSTIPEKIKKLREQSLGL